MGRHLGAAVLALIGSACVSELGPSLPGDLDVEVSPGDGESLFLRQPIRIEFSEPVERPASGGVIVRDGSIALTTTERSFDGRVLELEIDPQPIASAAIGTSLELVIDGAWATAADGRPLGADRVVRWHAPAWLPVGEPLTAGGTAVRVALGVRADGSPVVAWEERDGDDATVHLRAWSDAGWGPLAGRSNLGAGARPSIAVHGDEVAVAWDSAPGLVVSILRNGASALHVPTAESGASDTALAYDEGGDLWLAYSAAPSNERFGRVRVLRSGGWQDRWSLSARNDASTHCYDGAIAVRDGSVLVAWPEKQANPSNIRDVAAFAGATTASAVQIGGVLREAANPSQAHAPSVGIGADGGRWVAWSEQWSSGAERDAHLASWDPAISGWVARARFDLLPGMPYAPRIAMRGSTPIAAWREEDAAGDRQVVVALFDGIAWVPLGGGASTLPRTDASAHALAIDGWTLPVVAWVEDGAVRVARLNR